MKKTVLFSMLLVIGLITGIVFEDKTHIFSTIKSKMQDLIPNIQDDDYKIDFKKEREVSEVIEKRDEEMEILYWVAPMDPNFRRDEPGKSPMGMDLVPVYADSDGPGDADVVRISPEVVNNLGVRTEQVIRSRFARRINTVGYINFDESKISHVHLRAEGWINKLVINTEGERVKRGELLFTLYSPTLVNAQEEYLQALATTNKSLIRASEDRLHALGLTKGQIQKLGKDRKPTQYVGTYAPQSGVVSRLNIREGMYVKPETEVMALADLDTIWVQAEVFERQANWVAIGQTAEARLPSVPGRIWKGKVDYVYPELDPVTRTLRVRLRFDNPEEFLKPNMYADVSIISEHTKPVIHIPREALILDGDMPRVIIALGDGRFQSKAVIPGHESGDRVEIIEGLQEGDMVVVSAQFLIDSEASLKSSLRRMQPLPEQMDVKAHIHPVGKGIVNSIDVAKRIINITHESIEMLDWPAMTMDIGVGEEVNLEAVGINEQIKFYLGKDDSDTYIISHLAPVLNGDHQHD